MSVTRRGDKERRLAAFISRHLDQVRAAAPGAGREIRLIARSAESPVAKAIAALAAEIAAGGHRLRVIVAQPGRGASASWAVCDAGVADCEVRWARDPRLLEVHEQLVLGPSTCWTGDSMRRDPAKCDALETFTDDGAEAAGTAAASFGRLWAASEPLPVLPPVACGTDRPASPAPR
jgi:hypothetical protein